MSEEMKVEFKVAVGSGRPKPKPEQKNRAARQRQYRAARKARNLALAYWIDGLVRSGEVADLASVALACGVSRARLSAIVGLLGLPITEQERLSSDDLYASVQ